MLEQIKQVSLTYLTQRYLWWGLALFSLVALPQVMVTLTLNRHGSTVDASQSMVMVLGMPMFIVLPPVPPVVDEVPVEPLTGDVPVPSVLLEHPEGAQRYVRIAIAPRQEILRVIIFASLWSRPGSCSAGCG